ncbi:LysE family translocator [Brenneria sp. 4F2]|nr:LysE family translocator [Brenneria bubanii]
MSSLTLFIPFILTTLIFAYIPGPAMLYTAAQTLSRGRRSELMASLGIHLGGYAHVVAAAAGLTMLLHAFSALYSGVKLVGAAYLVWLGIKMLRLHSSQQAAVVTAEARKSAKRPLSKYHR